MRQIIPPLMLTVKNWQTKRLPSLMRTLRRTTKPIIINRSKIRRMLPIFCEKVWTMQPMLLMNLIRTLTAQVLSKHYLEEALELVVSRLSDLPVVA